MSWCDIYACTPSLLHPFPLSSRLQVFLDLWPTLFCFVGLFLVGAQQLYQVVQGFSDLSAKLMGILERKRGIKNEDIYESQWGKKKKNCIS